MKEKVTHFLAKRNLPNDEFNYEYFQHGRMTHTSYGPNSNTKEPLIDELECSEEIEYVEVVSALHHPEVEKLVKHTNTKHVNDLIKRTLHKGVDGPDLEEFDILDYKKYQFELCRMGIRFHFDYALTLTGSFHPNRFRYKPLPPEPLLDSLKFKSNQSVRKLHTFIKTHLHLGITSYDLRTRGFHPSVVLDYQTILKHHGVLLTIDGTAHIEKSSLEPLLSTHVARMPDEREDYHGS